VVGVGGRMDIEKMTFREAAEKWLVWAQTRQRKPIRPTSRNATTYLRQFTSFLGEVFLISHRLPCCRGHK